MLTVERLRQVLHYDPTTGIFTWLVATARQINAGDIAGSLDGDGYLAIQIDTRRYKAHRLAWLYVYGVWPIHQVDHKNCRRSDNRVANLREATNQQNSANSSLGRNNSSGFKGVFCRHNNRWEAAIKVNGKYKSLGCFNTPGDAHTAYEIAAQHHFGEFARAAVADVGQAAKREAAA